MLSEATTSVATADSLRDFTRCELVVPQLRERDAAGIIGELSRVLGQSDCVPDVLSFYQAVLNQGLSSDFAVPSGMAVAHARLSGVKRLQFAFGRTPSPVAWSAKDSWPVRLVFLLAVPATETTHYLQLLASIARLGQNSEAVTKLLAAPDASAILDVLRETGL
jgi:mannitol/fructose-specific phosphotransferase system IIA component (Ntr-type)